MGKRNKKKHRINRKPLVSVIITTKNEEDVIEKLLESIQKQSYSRIEIIVVDNFSSDETYDISKRYTKNVYEKGPERSVQRNYGFEKPKEKHIWI